VLVEGPILGIDTLRQGCRFSNLTGTLDLMILSLIPVLGEEQSQVEEDEPPVGRRATPVGQFQQREHGRRLVIPPLLGLGIR
jgi:hypothetical protein